MKSNKANRKSLIIVVVSAIAIIVSLVYIGIKAPSVRLSLAKGGEVLEGTLPNVEEHIDAVPEGEIRYLINKDIIFETPYSQGKVMLENPETCEYDLIFNVYNQDGELIYRSPCIAPGRCLERDKLTVVVDPGEHSCSYSAQAYKADKLVGQVTGVLDISVLSK